MTTKYTRSESEGDEEFTRRMRQATANALEITGYIERRTELRKIAEGVLHNSSACTDDWVADIAKKSPLIGKAKGQVNMRPTIAGLRDSMHERALVNIGALVPGCGMGLMDALTSPKVHGVESKRAKCGYQFGVHHSSKEVEEMKRWLSDEYGIRANFEEKETKTMTKMEKVEAPILVLEWSLGTLLQAWFGVLAESGREPAEVTAAMVECVEEAAGHRIGAVHDYVLAMGESEWPRGASVEGIGDEKVRELAERMMRRLGEDGPAELGLPDSKHADLIDLALERSGLPPIREIIRQVNDGRKTRAAMEKEIEKAKEAAKRAASMAMPVSMEVKASGEVPEGRFKMVKASEAFGLTKAEETFGFEVPLWEWDGEHPLVPQVDEDYLFRPDELFAMLMGVVKNSPTYLHGHTGTGKTSLVQQVAARLSWPFMRVNFDSDISRMDLIGRDTLTNEGEGTVSRFVEGVLPQMMQGPILGCFDEIDFVRPDVGYVFQRSLEGDGLVLTEDGGRVIRPHPMFRIFATGNTVGQGDEHGMYQGARPQSLALLDRFVNWIEVKYLEEPDRRKLIEGAAPGLDGGMLSLVCAYVTEHLSAFNDAKVLQPLSPRGYMALADQVSTYVSLYPNSMRKQAITRAFEATVLARASMQDRVVLTGLLDRLM